MPQVQYVLFDQCRLRHQHVIKLVFQCWCSTRGMQVPLTAHWYTTTPSILQLNSRYRRKYMLLMCLLKCTKLNNACPTFKSATWSSDSLLDVWNVTRQNFFQNTGYLGWGFHVPFEVVKPASSGIRHRAISTTLTQSSGLTYSSTLMLNPAGRGNVGTYLQNFTVSHPWERIILKFFKAFLILLWWKPD